MEVNLGSSVPHDPASWYSNNNAKSHKSESIPLDYDAQIHHSDFEAVPVNYDFPSHQPFFDISNMKAFVEQIESYFEKENYDQVLKHLSTLFMRYHKQEEIPKEDTRLIYDFVNRLMPHLGPESLNKLVSQLTDFLVKTSHFPEEQLTIANLIGVQHCKHRNWKAAMHHFAKALLIAKQHHLPEAPHLISSIFSSYISQRKIKQVLEAAISYSVSNKKPQMFEIQLNRIRQLQACLGPENQTFIRSLYEQVQQTMLDILNIKVEYRESFSPFSETIIKGLTQSPIVSETLPVQKYRTALEAFRAQFKQLYTSQQNIFDPKGVRQFQKEVAQNFKTFFEIFLSDIFVLLGEPACDYDFRAMGSLGREEMCPYSDLEWFPLISDFKFQPDIVSIAELLELQMISLGETALENPVCFSSVLVKSGLHIDIGGNPARDPSLIGTPFDLAKEQAPFEKDQMITANDTSSTMRKSASLASKGNLIEPYQQASREILVSPLPPEEIIPLSKTVGERRAIRFLEKHLKDFKEVWKGPPKDSIDLKTHYVELINHLMTTLSLFYNISETNTLDIIDKLIEKKVFTPYSGELLKETVAGIYMIRVRFHFFYEEQREEIPLDKLNQRERNLLNRSYWIILRPLYQLIEKWLKTKHPLFQVDLLDFAIEKIPVDLSLETFPNHYKEVISLMASLIHSTDYHLKAYQKLSQFFQFEPLREAYLNQVDREIFDVLLEIPNRAGLRRAYIRDYQNFEQVFASLVTDQSFPGAVKVTTPFLDPDKTYYLKPEVASAILEKGKIKRQYSNSAHSVIHYQAPQCDFHFKGVPSHPMMEYAIHALTSRIMGKGTPPVHLIRLDTKAGPHPVLVSETIPGTPLQEGLSFELKHLTWMLLCQVITHPGDGRPPNFVVDEKGCLFCVDNDVSFMEAMVDKKVYFASALFCLKGKINGKEQEVLNTPLAEEILEKFCALDVPLILGEWLDDVIEKEAQALTLFSEEERETLFREDPSNLSKVKNRFSQENQQKLFTPRILFQKGAIASLCAQFFSLQRMLSEKFLKKKPVTPLDLLDSLTTLGKKVTNQVSLGRQVGKFYLQAQKLSTLEKRYQQITGRTQSISQAQSQTITYGKPLKLEEIEKGEKYSPIQAKEELLITSVTWVGNAKVTQDKEAITLKADFSNIKQKGLPDIERQRFLINGLNHWMKLYQSKPSEIHITYCSVINDENLFPFLHKDLQVLNLTGCSRISNAVILRIEKNCPKLQELYLSGTDITAFASPNLLGFNLIAIAMPKLQILHLSCCSKLDTIRLNTPLLEQLKTEKSFNLKWIELSDLYSVKLTKESKARINVKNRANLGISPFVLATYEKATIGDAFAQSKLAIHFHSGKEVKRNDEKCLYWHKQAVANNPQAQTELAIRFHRGDGVRQNDEKCLYWHEQAVANNPQAQTELALRFHKGDGVRQSDEKCLYWHERVVANNPQAQLGLAQLYFNGQGVKRNLDQAAYWSQRAAPNEAKARMLLAQCYIETPVNLTHITSLDLDDCSDVTDGVLESLVKKCLNLTHLNLSKCKQITSTELAIPTEELPLEISSGWLVLLKNIFVFLHLKEALFGTPLPATGLSHLALLTHLQKLNLSWCKQITGAGLFYLTPLTQLQKLNLSHCDKITDEGLSHLTPLTELRELDLSYCDRITDAGLSHLVPLTQLQKLDLSYCHEITKVGLSHLKMLTSLQQLDLSYCHKITKAGLSHLTPLTHLQQLNLRNCSQITDAGLFHLTPLTELRALDLSSCSQITDVGLFHLRTFTHLQQLDLSSCSQITDRGLSHLTPLTQLQQLNLYSCDKITDVGLAYFKTFNK